MNPELDLSVIKIFLNREWYELYNQYISWELITPEAKKVLYSIKRYYNENESVSSIDLSSFYLWFIQTNKDLFPEQQKYYKLIFDRIALQDSQDVSLIIDKIKQEKLWDSLYKLKNSGFDVTKMIQELENYQDSVGKTTQYNHIPITTESLTQHIRTEGLRFRLSELNKILVPLVAGDFVVVFAGTNVGKTAWLISELSYMAQQLKGDEKAIYFNNEANANNIPGQLISATLKTPLSVINATEHNRKLAIKKYTEIMAGDLERIVTIDVYGKGKDTIEEECRKYNTKLIAIDQIDNIMIHGNETHDRIYANLYEWARSTLSSKYGPVLASTQAAQSKIRYFSKQEGKFVNKQWLDSGDMHWSSTDKPGAITYMIGITDNPSFPDIRYVSIPKAKAAGEYHKGNNKFTCTIKPEMFLYED